MNFFSFLYLHKCFWILLAYLCVGSSSITLAFRSCSSIFLIASPSDKIFTSGPNLKSLLRQKKTKLWPNCYPAVYELKCTCNSAYFGETKKKILTRTLEHQQDSSKGKWDDSGATEDSFTCHGQFNWIHPKIIARENDYTKRKILETLEIKRAKYNKNIKVLKRDEGKLVKTNPWWPLLANINEM